jgi:hypothetical protein
MLSRPARRRADHGGSMTDKEFTCAACHQTFKQGWTDADAESEAEQVFGVTGASRRSDMAVMCDDCYAEFMRWLAEAKKAGKV